MPGERWAQLTYASFDAGAGTRGGWQVKDRAGELTEVEVERIKSRVVTNFEPTSALPKFPTPEDVQALPRRLVYAPIEGMNTFAYWQAVQSGMDGTGRPGNVFTHVLVDRAPEEVEPAVRPINLWRADFWLSPFGQQEVLAATVDPHLRVHPGDAITKDSVIAFLVDPAVWRGAVFSVLLDALLGAINGGSKVAIAAESPDAVALWLGAVTHLMAPANSRRIGFSVYERATGLEAAFARGALIVGIPYEDIESALKLPSVVVIDDRQSPAMGDLGGRAHRVGEVDVAVTAWSVMAQVAMQEPGLASVVFDRIDEVSADIGGPVTPAWPLAMVVALLKEDLADAASEAFEVLRDESPAEMASNPVLWEAASVLAQPNFGTTAGEAWEQVATTQGDTRSVLNDLAVRVYQDRVLSDPSWLVRPEGVPGAVARTPGGTTQHIAARFAAELASCRRRAVAGESVEVVALRLADWGLRSEIVSDDAAAGDLEQLLKEVVVPTLCDATRGPVLVAAVGAVGEHLLSGWLRRLVDQECRDSAGARRLSPVVVKWLYPDPESPLVDSSGGLSEVAADAVVMRCAAGHPSGFTHRAKAILALVELDRLGESERAALFRVDAPMSTAEVLLVESNYPQTLPPRIVEHALLSAPWDDDLDALCLEIQRTASIRANARLLTYLVSLRGAGARIASTGAVLPEDLRFFGSVLPLMVAHYGPQRQIAGIGLACVASLCILAVRDERAGWISREVLSFAALNARDVSTDASRAVAARAISDGLVGPTHFAVAAAMVACAQRESPVHVSLQWDLLARIPEPSTGEVTPFLSVLADELAVASRDITVDLAQAVTYVERGLSDDGDSKAVARRLGEFERHTKPLWKHYKSLQDPVTRARPGVLGFLGLSTSTDKDTD